MPSLPMINLPAPTGVRVSGPREDSLNVNWNLVAGADRYSIHVLDSTGAVVCADSGAATSKSARVGNDTNATGTDVPLAPGTTYTVRVRAGKKDVGWGPWAYTQGSTTGARLGYGDAGRMASARLPFAGEPWTLGFGGVLLGGASPLVPLAVDGLAAMPDVKAHDLELINWDGLLPGRDYMRGRTVTMTFRVLADNFNHLDLLMGEVSTAFTHSRDEHPLEFNLPGVAQGAWAKVNGRVRKRSAPVDDTYGALAPIVDVQFECTEPWIEAVRSISRPLAATSVFRRGGFQFPTQGGMRFPFRIPRNGGWGGFQTAMATNGSMDHSDLRAVINGPIEGPQFVCRENGLEVGRVGITQYADGAPFSLQRGERLELYAEANPNTGALAKGSALFYRRDDDESPVDMTAQLTASKWATMPAGRTVECAIEYTKMSYDGAATGYVEWKPGRFV